DEHGHGPQRPRPLRRRLLHRLAAAGRRHDRLRHRLYQDGRADDAPLRADAGAQVGDRDGGLRHKRRPVPRRLLRPHGRGQGDSRGRLRAGLSAAARGAHLRHHDAPEEDRARPAGGLREAAPGARGRRRQRHGVPARAGVHGDQRGQGAAPGGHKAPQAHLRLRAPGHAARLPDGRRLDPGRRQEEAQGGGEGEEGRREGGRRGRDRDGHRRGRRPEERLPRGAGRPEGHGL
ncbi:MAG: NADH-ubiquinone oxidoreductase chain B, partial [uncultured Rubrobacteraceae bacterium]